MKILYGFDALTIPNTSESLDGQDPITIDGQSGLVDVYKELKTFVRPRNIFFKVWILSEIYIV